MESTEGKPEKQEEDGREETVQRHLPLINFKVLQQINSDISVMASDFWCLDYPNGTGTNFQSLRIAACSLHRISLI